MLYNIRHQTLFEYSGPVSESVIEFRLTPLTDTCQHVIQCRSVVSPTRPIRTYYDSFGNTVSYFNILFPVDRVEIDVDSVVETLKGSRMPPDLIGIDPVTSGNHIGLYEYLQPTRLTGWSPPCLEYASRFDVLRGAPPLDVAEAIRTAVYEGFRYLPGATTSASTIDDLLHGGAGVCQDFAHLMIAICRWLKYPARYVSGYVYTDLSEEQSVASHAWVEVFDPERGWLGVDPTHNRWVQEHHVRIGVGRDFADVTPNKGVYRGAVEERISVTVQLKTLEPNELELGARRLLANQIPRSFATRQVRKPLPASILQQTSAAQQQQ